MFDATEEMAGPNVLRGSTEKETNTHTSSNKNMKRTEHLRDNQTIKLLYSITSPALLRAKLPVIGVMRNLQYKTKLNLFLKLQVLLLRLI